MNMKRTTTTSNDLRRIYRHATTPGEMGRAIPLITRIRARPLCWLTEDEEQYIARVVSMYEGLVAMRKKLGIRD